LTGTPAFCGGARLAASVGVAHGPVSANDVVAVVSAARTGSVRHDHVDPFDTPSGVAAAPHHPTGYGHGV